MPFPLTSAIRNQPVSVAVAPRVEQVAADQRFRRRGRVREARSRCAAASCRRRAASAAAHRPASVRARDDASAVARASPSITAREREQRDDRRADRDGEVDRARAVCASTRSSRSRAVAQLLRSGAQLVGVELPEVVWILERIRPAGVRQQRFGDLLLPGSWMPRTDCRTTGTASGTPAAATCCARSVDSLVEQRVRRAVRVEKRAVARRDEAAQAGLFGELLAEDRVDALARGGKADLRRSTPHPAGGCPKPARRSRRPRRPPAGAGLEATPRFELGMELLQSSALPLGYVADPGPGAGGGNRTRASTLGRSQATITSHPRSGPTTSGSRVSPAVLCLIAWRRLRLPAVETLSILERNAP